MVPKRQQYVIKFDIFAATLARDVLEIFTESFAEVIRSRDTMLSVPGTLFIIVHAQQAILSLYQIRFAIVNSEFI